MAEIDPQTALALARTGSMSHNAELENLVWEAWARLSFEEAIEAAADEPNPINRRRAARGLYRAVGPDDTFAHADIERILGARPDNWTMYQYIGDLVSDSPARAARHVETIADKDRQVGQARRLAQVMVSNGTIEEVGGTPLFSDTSLQRAFEGAALQALARQDPEAFVVARLNQPMKGDERSAIATAMGELASRDLGRAQELFEQISGSQVRSSIASRIAREMARDDPYAAFEWARAEDRSDWGSGLWTVVQTIAKTDPYVALDLVQTVENANARVNLLSSMAQAFSTHSPELIATMLTGIEDDRTYRAVASHHAVNLLNSDPDEALAFALNARDSAKVELMRSLGDSLPQIDLHAALRLVTRVDDRWAEEWLPGIARAVAVQRSGEEAMALISQYAGRFDTSAMMGAVIGGIARSDPDQAIQLVGQIPDAAVRDLTLQDLIVRKANTSPREALRLSRQLQNGLVKGQVTQAAIANWAMNSPEEAENWVLNEASREVRDDAIAGLSGSWTELTAERTRLIESIDDEDKRAHAYTTILFSVARNDWRKAEAMIDEMNLPDQHKQQFRQMLRRFRYR